MKNKIIIFISLNIFGCVDDYDIDPYINQVYDAYGNLGFEEGMDHWYGSANMFSTIAIDENSYEGQNSLKLSINIDSTSNNGSIVEVSKSLNVVPGDTISVTHDKFGFSDKYFRIENINYQSDCTASITAREYHSSFYTISPETLPTSVKGTLASVVLDSK